MARLLALVVLLLAGSADPAGFGRGGGLTCPKGYVGGGLTPCVQVATPYSYALFELAPPTGLGMPSECSADGVVAVINGGESTMALALTRAGVAECPSNDGQTLTQVPSNVVVVSSGRTDSTQLGVWLQPTRGNYVLYSRDMSRAAWVKTDVTCTLTATGMRGDTNGASRCTATAAGGTILQPLAMASARRATSFRVRRVAGIGSVNVTMNGGTNWYPTSLAATGWTWITPTQTPGCAPVCNAIAGLSDTVLNPSIGIQLETPGDSVDVDFAQIEDGPYASLPIETGVAPAVRQPETLTGTTIPFIESSGCSSVTIIPQDSNGIGLANHFLIYTAASAWELYYNTADSTSRIYDGVHDIILSSSLTGGEPASRTSYWTGTTLVVQNTTAGTQAIGVFDGSMTQSSLLIGGPSTYSPAGVIKNIRIDTEPSHCINRQIDWIGDSIIAGTGSAPNTPPVQLGATIERVVVNGGVGGNTTAQCSARWFSTYRFGRSSVLVWSCGVNDVANGIDGETAAANTKTVVLDALSISRTVFVTSIAPWKTSGGWTQPKQDQGDHYNLVMADWCPTHGCTFVSAAGLGGEGGDIDMMLAIYDAGDHIHPNAAGAGVLAAAVAGASP